MLQTLILQIISGILGLWLATQFVAGCEFTGPVKTLLLAGAVLGIINSLLKPILKTITWPLRLLTLGLFSLVINGALIWLVDIFFPELVIDGLIPLFWTTIIVSALSIILFLLGKGTAKEA